jgi:hypothetical protein
LFWIATGTFQRVGDSAEMPLQIRIRMPLSGRRLQDHPVGAIAFRHAGEVDLRARLLLGHCDRIRHAAGDAFAHHLDGLLPLGRVHFVHFGDKTQHHDAVSAGRDAMIHLAAHRFAIEQTGAIEEGVENRIHTTETPPLGPALGSGCHHGHFTEPAVTP